MANAKMLVREGGGDMINIKSSFTLFNYLNGCFYIKKYRRKVSVKLMH